MICFVLLSVLFAAATAEWYPSPYLSRSENEVQYQDPLFTPPLNGNPSVRPYGYGFLGPRNRDNGRYLDVIGTRGTYGWGTYRPTYYDATSRRVHPWTTSATGLLPWADSFHGNGLQTNYEAASAVSNALFGEDSEVYSPYDLYTNSQVNPLGVDPALPGGESPLLSGGNPHGHFGIGSLNLGTPVGLSYMGTGAGTGVGWYKSTDGHPLPYYGYGPQGSGGIGSGTPLTEHPIFKTLPGLYHPPASNVFY
jgi:hypothetical protein